MINVMHQRAEGKRSLPVKGLHRRSIACNGSLASCQVVSFRESHDGKSFFSHENTLAFDDFEWAFRRARISVDSVV